VDSVARISWWEWIPFPWRRWRIVALVEAADEIPPHLPKKGVVVVGEPQYLKWIAFDCPCGSGHRIMVTVDQGHLPRWTIASAHPLTVSPSFDYRVPGQRCHFFMRAGRVLWVNDQFGGQL
jgi:hypothetical protein